VGALPPNALPVTIPAMPVTMFDTTVTAVLNFHERMHTMAMIVRATIAKSLSSMFSGKTLKYHFFELS
jgi:hypothetical protein